MIFVILFLSLILRLISINQSLWLDEAITATIARDLTFLQIINNYLPFDNHPPLYLILIHFWLKIVPNTELFLRLPSIIFGVATIFIIFQIGKELLSKKLGLITALLLSLSPLHIYYPQENRMYALNTLLVSLLILVTLKYLKISKNIYLFFYFLVGALIIYTDYLPILMFLVTTSFIYLSKKLSFKWVFLHLAIFLTYIPWLPFFFKQFFLGVEGRNGSELFDLVLGKFTINGLPLTFEKFVLGRIPVDLNYGLILILPILTFFLFLICYSLIKTEKIYKLKIGLWIFIPTLSAYIASLFLPVFLHFRLLFVLPAFYLLIGFGILGFKKRVAIALLIICIAINSTASFYYFTNPNIQREDWRQASIWLNQEVTNSDLILFASGDPFPPFSWYYPKHQNAKGAFSGFYVTQSDKEKVENLINGKERIFVLNYLQAITDPEVFLQQWIINSGYKNTVIKNFIGVGEIQIYEKKLY